MPILERNLRLFGWHQAIAGLIFWFPTSFLYFISKVGLAAGARLLAVYFLAVVVLEVPSGWMSDRYGRVLTLRLSAISWISAFSLFSLSGIDAFVGAGFMPGGVDRSALAALVLAQIFLAAGYALRSGTDASFHYDTLESLSRSAEFEKRESVVGRNMFTATAAAAAIGGVRGYVDLRLPFAVALVAAVMQLAVTLWLVEPAPIAAVEELEGTSPADRATSKGQGQLGQVVGYVKSPAVAWVFLFMTVQQPLEGLAGDLLQPWLAELVDRPLDESRLAALYSGFLMTVIALVGAGVVGTVPVMRSRLGFRGALVTLAAVEVVIIVGMALLVSPLLIPVLMLRSSQAAAGPVLVAAEVAPLLARHHRATFLSMGSLSGRLFYGIVLVGLGAFEVFSQQARFSAVIAVASFSLLAIGAVLFPGSRKTQLA